MDMLSRVLLRLESLQADLSAIDPAHQIDAADRVAEMAVALRDLLATATAPRVETSAEEAARRAG